MTVTQFHDFPVADVDRDWDGTAAEKRVRSWAKADDGPNAAYRDAHVWYDSDKADNFGSYKFLIADVVNGQLLVVPRGVMAAGGVIDGARGGADVPDDEVPRIKSHLARYYRKFDHTPPWES
ncbi:MAG: hypothetical protein ACRDZY_14545 [Acidimicrobiales bacterium]